MVTEAPWKVWSAGEFTPYLDAVFEAFGADRVMIGSDWPVCTLSGDYATTMRIVVDYVEQFPQAVRERILGDTCTRVYRLGSRTGKPEDQEAQRPNGKTRSRSLTSQPGTLHLL